jgi:prepilin-type processing-associated H-X9-DG protein
MDYREVQGWLEQNGIDAIAAVKGKLGGLEGVRGLRTVSMRDLGWDALPEKLVATTERETALQPTPDKARMFAFGGIPFDFFFKTGDGGMGVLQLLEVHSPHIGTRIRYKMIEDVRKIEYELKLAKSANNLKQMGLALAMFANDNNQKLPDNLQQLDHYIGNKQDFQWILENVEYLGKGKKHVAGSFNVVTAYDKTLLEEGNGTNVLFADGHVKFEVPGRLEELGIKPKIQ